MGWFDSAFSWVTSWFTFWSPVLVARPLQLQITYAPTYNMTSPTPTPIPTPVRMSYLAVASTNLPPQLQITNRELESRIHQLRHSQAITCEPEITLEETLQQVKTQLRHVETSQ